MISVKEAKEFIRNHISILPSVTLPLADAVGYVLAEDVFSPTDFPPFNQSSVDGYAIFFNDAKEQLIINGESAAGNNENFSLAPKHAMRIFTGAAVPDNADTIVMQENTSIENGKLTIQDAKLKYGANFRPKGKDVQKGAIALRKNDFLSATAVGFLAGLGVARVNVIGKPTISIIVTGNELQTAGKTLEFGQVYESNSFALKAALSQLHFHKVTVTRVADDLKELTNILSHSLEIADVIILCGGISVGEYDFVLEATINCGAEKIFHKVKQRPGKPLYFGKKENKLVFGLPGNPSSVLTCFYEYVVPALDTMMNKSSSVQVKQCKLNDDYKKISGLHFFLKGLYENDSVTILDAQESYRLSSFAKANCLVSLEEDREKYNAGDLVEIHILPL